MTDRIEEAAKAMWDVRRAHANNSGVELEFWGDGTIPKANGIMDEARAAIEAIREPPDGFGKIVYHGEYADDVWRDMINTALSSVPQAEQNQGDPEKALLERCKSEGFYSTAGRNLVDLIKRAGLRLEFAAPPQS